MPTERLCERPLSFMLLRDIAGVDLKSVHSRTKIEEDAIISFELVEYELGQCGDHGTTIRIDAWHLKMGRYHPGRLNALCF